MQIIKIDTDFTPETHTLGSSSAQSSAIITGSGIVRIAVRGTHAHIKIGYNPTATEESILMPENTVEYFQIRSGQQVAFIKKGDGNGEINFCAID
jgi:hypothetical protein